MLLVLVWMNPEQAVMSSEFIRRTAQCFNNWPINQPLWSLFWPLDRRTMKHIAEHELSRWVKSQVFDSGFEICPAMRVVRRGLWFATSSSQQWRARTSWWAGSCRLRRTEVAAGFNRPPRWPVASECPKSENMFVVNESPKSPHDL